MQSNKANFAVNRVKSKQNNGGMMRLAMINKQILTALLFICFSFNPVFGQKNNDFVIVIDPGHGGKDIGARGVGQNEKDITLDVSLRLARLIEKNHKDVKVILTREDDRFLELWERARVANKNHANLFVSIHCNSANNRSAFGSETYVMGLRRMDENMEVSKRENSVILLEDDQERYQRFDPNDEEAVIAFEIMHSAYLDQSIRFAQLVEGEFVDSGRFSRGVKQNIFHVLRQNASPAVLVELGFISNHDEGTFLATSKGKDKMAEALLSAFSMYKKEYDSKNAPLITEVDDTPKPPETPVAGKTFKVQILVSKNKYAPSDKKFNGITNIEVVQTGEVYKYFFGHTNLVSERDALLDYAKHKGFKDAFVVEVLNDEALTGNQNYRIQFLVSNKRYRERDKEMRGLKDILRVKKGDFMFYYYGSAKTYEESRQLLDYVKSKGFRDAFVVTFDGKRQIN